MSDVKKAVEKIHYELKKMIFNSHLSDASYRFWLEHEKEIYQLAAGFANPLPCIDIERIKQNGLAPDSPLLWALLPDWVEWIAKHKNGDWYGYGERPIRLSLCDTMWYADAKTRIYLNYPIVKNCDWKDSLTRRPEGM